MIELFEKYVDMKILGLFLGNPDSEFHVKEIGRKLNISPASASHAVKYFAECGYLMKEEKGLAHLYRLNVAHPIIVSMKKAYGMALVLSANPIELFLSADANIVSFALYGSYADGSFDDHSEIDFLIVAPSAVDKFSNSRKLSDSRKLLEEKLGRPVSLFVATMSIWSTMKSTNDPMYNKILENHILIYGNGLAGH
jgi:predicted nucleotidyltransferase